MKNEETERNAVDVSVRNSVMLEEAEFNKNLAIIGKRHKCSWGSTGWCNGIDSNQCSHVLVLDNGKNACELSL